MLRSLTMAKRLFLAGNRDLLENNTHERTIGEQFAVALRQCYPSYHVNTDYNKNLRAQKMAFFMGKRRGILPDVLVHTRQTHARNHLAIEIKPEHAAGRDVEKDRAKLRALRRVPYLYPHTYLMRYSVGDGATIWFEEVL